MKPTSDEFPFSSVQLSCFNPSPQSLNNMTSVALLTEMGIYHGSNTHNSFLLSENSVKAIDMQYMPFVSVSDEPRQKPLSMESTEFHFLVLYSDRIEVN